MPGGHSDGAFLFVFLPRAGTGRRGFEILGEHTFDSSAGRVLEWSGFSLILLFPSADAQPKLSISPLAVDRC